MQLTPLEQIVLDTIEEIQSIKRDRGVAPRFATMLEVSNSFNVDLKEAINSLIRKDRLEWHENINGVPLFGIKN